MNDLENEHKLVFEKKDIFEKMLISEIEYFDKTYGNLLSSCLNAVFEIIVSRDNSVIFIYYNF